MSKTTRVYFGALQVVFSRILLILCHGKASIVATFILLFALSFVATIVKLSQNCELHALAKSTAFLTFFCAFFPSKSLQNTNLGEGSIILN